MIKQPPIKPGQGKISCFVSDLQNAVQCSVLFASKLLNFWLWLQLIYLPPKNHATLISTE